VENKIRNALTGDQRASLAYGGRALAPLPAPTPRKYKSKNFAADGGVGPAFEAAIRTMLDQTKCPGDEPEDVRPTPFYPNPVSGRFAIGPRIMNP
jgi:hypothetical protein